LRKRSEAGDWGRGFLPVAAPGERGVLRKRASALTYLPTQFTRQSLCSRLYVRSREVH